MLVAGGVVSGEQWPLLDYRNGAWFGGRVRALERLADLVKADTRVVPADGRLITGRDIVRHRDIYRELFETMIGYMNMGFGAEDVVEHNPLAKYRDRARRPVRVSRWRLPQHVDCLRAGLRAATVGGARARRSVRAGPSRTDELVAARQQGSYLPRNDPRTERSLESRLVERAQCLA